MTDAKDDSGEGDGETEAERNRRQLLEVARSLAKRMESMPTSQSQEPRHTSTRFFQRKRPSLSSCCIGLAVLLFCVVVFYSKTEEPEPCGEDGVCLQRLTGTRGDATSRKWDCSKPGHINGTAFEEGRMDGTMTIKEAKRKSLDFGLIGFSFVQDSCPDPLEDQLCRISFFDGSEVTPPAWTDWVTWSSCVRM